MIKVLVLCDSVIMVIVHSSSFRRRRNLDATLIYIGAVIMHFDAIRQDDASCSYAVLT